MLCLIVCLTIVRGLIVCDLHEGQTLTNRCKSCQNGDSNKETIYDVSLFITGRLNSTVHIRDI